MLGVLALGLSISVGVGFVAPPSAAAAAKAAAPAQKHFATPEDAVTALVDALKSGDTKALLAVLGPDGSRVAESGDPVADREGREAFVQAFEEKHALDKKSDTEMILETGKDAWPMPIPIVKDDQGWHFDSHAGAEEILNRRIGRNELSAIQASLAYVDAQREYYHRDPEKSGLMHYARYILSTPGKRDGLYFETKEGEEESPLGRGFANARAHGYKGEHGKQEAYHGYYFKVLTGQGSHAEGGAYGYLARGVMLGGFALVAYPATWDNSGVMTFIVNQDGVVYEKDLGPKTASIAQAMTKFDPDETWKPVTDQDEEVPAETASTQ
jgi:hypothetical protein